MVTWRVPFFAALPHELDGPGPYLSELPLYVKRVDDLMHHAQQAADEINRLRHDLAQTRTALLIYGQHLPICGTHTASDCDCTWAEWQRDLEKS